MGIEFSCKLEETGMGRYRGRAFNVQLGWGIRDEFV
jgi:hypothetical protein